MDKARLSQGKCIRKTLGTGRPEHLDLQLCAKVHSDQIAMHPDRSRLTIRCVVASEMLLGSESDVFPITFHIDVLG